MLKDWTPKKIAWSLRKLALHIPRGALVLDVGSGSHPHPRADILLEKFVDPMHRYEALVADRPTVLSDASTMPFRDKTFDYVIAFHVLEHIKDPSAFLSELQRVGKAGYIETPNVFFERICPYDVHVSEVMDVDGVLVINKKNGPRPDEYLNELELLRFNRRWKQIFYGDPKLFHVQYHWNKHINYRIVNPGVSIDWLAEPSASAVSEEGISRDCQRKSLRAWALYWLRNYYVRKNQRNVNLRALLVCPRCRGELADESDFLTCVACRFRYRASPIPNFTDPAPM